MIFFKKNIRAMSTEDLLCIGCPYVNASWFTLAKTVQKCGMRGTNSKCVVLDVFLLVERLTSPGFRASLDVV